MKGEAQDNFLRSAHKSTRDLLGALILYYYFCRDKCICIPWRKINKRFIYKQNGLKKFIYMNRLCISYFINLNEISQNTNVYNQKTDKQNFIHKEHFWESRFPFPVVFTFLYVKTENFFHYSN